MLAENYTILPYVRLSSLWNFQVDAYIELFQCHYSGKEEKIRVKQWEFELRAVGSPVLEQHLSIICILQQVFSTSIIPGTFETVQFLPYSVEKRQTTQLHKLDATFESGGTSQFVSNRERRWEISFKSDIW